MRFRLMVLVVAIAATLVSQVSVGSDGELVVYSGRSDKFVKPVMAAFTKETGIKVVLHAAKSTALLNKLRNEGAKTSADLFISNDAGNLQLGANLGLFDEITATDVQLIPDNYRAKNNLWVGLSARARVLVVNSESKAVDGVNSILDLARPELKGKIGITSSTNGSFIAGVTVYMEAMGQAKTQQWLEGITENAGGAVFNKHSKIVKAVARGKKAVGLVNHYYIYRHLAKYPDAPIKIVLPDQGDEGIGVAWNVAGIAISKYSNHKVRAEKLVAFLLSKKGQLHFSKSNREYPTLPGVEAASDVPAAGSYKVAAVPMSELGNKRIETLDLIEKVGMP